MMSWLRKRNKEILLVTFLAFLLGGVVFTGVEGFSLTPQSAVLIVNGEKIPYRRFESLLARALERQEGSLTPEKTAQLKDSVLKELTQEAVFLQEARRYDIRATDAEVAALIQNAPPFQRDGRFDQNLYLTYVVQALRTTPANFEDEQRRFLRRQKLVSLLSSSIRVSEGEAREFLRRQGGRFSKEDRETLMRDPEKLRRAAGEEQANAAFQTWIQRLNEKLKMEELLDRWEKRST